MRHLSKIAAVAVAALALIAPAAAQADPGINVSYYSDGSVTFHGRATCTWSNVPVNAFPPDTVTVPATSVAVSCDNGYWGNVNANIVVTFNDTPEPDEATVQSMDVTGGALFFWCRYQTGNLKLFRTDNKSNPDRRDYAGGPWSIPLYASNWADQCSNPASVSAQVTFRRVP